MTTSAGHAVATGGRDIHGDSAWGPPGRRAVEPLPTTLPVPASALTFEQLYAAHYAPMVRLAHSLVDSRQRAEEVVQDAFAAVYERFDRVASPVAYLRTCVLNGCRRVIRRRMLRRSRPFATVDSAELTYNHVLDAIRRLPHKQRSMIALRYDLQLTDAEIAATLGVPLGTVKSTLYRALTALRQEIEK